MTTSVKIIADSISRLGNRITTMEISAPYIIWPQVLTHRAFSRNAQSNRAIPTSRLIQRVLENPYNPVFRANQKGMVAGKELVTQEEALEIWDKARQQAIGAAQSMESLQVHKETVNRLLLPFMHITALVTATEWENYFKLRIADDAQPEIQELAAKMRTSLFESSPKLLGTNEWHLPYVTETGNIKDLIRLSTARCARVSYLTHDNTNPSVDDDLRLYDDLMSSDPIHGSPAEHPATPISDALFDHSGTHKNWNGHKWGANLRGWKSHRTVLERM